MPQVINRANYPDLLAVGFRKRFFDEYNRYPTEYTSLYNFETSDRAYEEFHDFTGFGLVPTKAEGAGIQYDAPIAGWTKKLTHTTYAMGFQVTMEMMADDQSRFMNQLPTALGYSMHVTQEVLGAQILNTGGSTTVFTGPDGKALFATDHPMRNPDAPVGLNDAASAADLSETSLEQALYDISLWTDDRGLKIMCRPTTLVIHPKDEFRAQKLLNTAKVPDLGVGLNSTSGGVASGQNKYGPNDINPLQGRFTVEIKHYLTDDDTWFIRCDKHYVLWLWRMKPTFDRDNDFETKNARYQVIGRWSRGFTNWRGWYRCQGA